ncbi:hypothetical protein [Candidatus Uabimicrobium sp. HlEnr_7]|uniref:hypothetical protein n=1 Tax=Candidatus Uabimicrobium helgolandensis TaxID=3095367 RepID=UPI003557986F
METTEKQENLQPEEKKKLFQHFIGIFIFIAILLGFLVVLYQNTDDDILRSILGVLSVFFVGIPLWMVNSYFVDWSMGQKSIVRGIIADRKMKKMKKSNSSTTYSIIIDQKEIVVDFKQYAIVGTGDLVEIHYSPRSNISFKLQVVKPAKEIFRNKSETENIKFDVTEDNYDEQDKRVLKKQLFSRLMPRIFMFVFAAWIVVGLSLSGMYAFLILLFPFPIMLIVSTFKIIKEIYRYFSDCKMGKKIIYSTQITDKNSYQEQQTIYRVITRTLHVDVSQEAYNAAIMFDPMEIHVSKYLNTPIAVVINNNNYSV